MPALPFDHGQMVQTALARVRSQLLVRRARHLLQDQNAALESEVARRMRENELIQAVSIRALAHLAPA